MQSFISSSERQSCVSIALLHGGVEVCDDRLEAQKIFRLCRPVDVGARQRFSNLVRPVNSTRNALKSTEKAVSRQFTDRLYSGQA